MRNSITIFIASIIVAAAQPVYAQSGGQAMPFVLLDADARTAGMAGAGGILPDNPSAVRHNAAAVLAGEHKAGLDLAAGPWNTDFDMSEVLYAASGYWNIDGRNGILAGVRCISGEDIVLTDEWGYHVGTAHPYDFAIEAGYARGFGEHFSVALTVMYMQSDLGIGEGPMRGVSFDAAGVYRRSAGFLDGARWGVGVKAAGLGPDIVASSGSSSRLPVRAGAGGYIRLPFSSDHVLNLAADLEYRFSASAFEAAAGAEYVFLKHGILRAGYHLGPPVTGGNRAAVGCGFIAGPVRCDAAWRFAGQGPLGNTLCLTVGLLL